LARLPDLGNAQLCSRNSDLRRDVLFTCRAARLRPPDFKIERVVPLLVNGCDHGMTLRFYPREDALFDLKRRLLPLGKREVVMTFAPFSEGKTNGADLLKSVNVILRHPSDSAARKRSDAVAGAPETALPREPDDAAAADMHPADVSAALVAAEVSDPAVSGDVARGREPNARAPLPRKRAERAERGKASERAERGKESARPPSRRRPATPPSPELSASPPIRRDAAAPTESERALPALLPLRWCAEPPKKSERALPALLPLRRDGPPPTKSERGLPALVPLRKGGPSPTQRERGVPPLLPISGEEAAPTKRERGVPPLLPISGEEAAPTKRELGVPPLLPISREEAAPPPDPPREMPPLRPVLANAGRRLVYEPPQIHSEPKRACRDAPLDASKLALWCEYLAKYKTEHDPDFPKGTCVVFAIEDANMKNRCDADIKNGDLDLSIKSFPSGTFETFMNNHIAYVRSGDYDEFVACKPDGDRRRLSVRTAAETDVQLLKTCDGCSITHPFPIKVKGFGVHPDNSNIKLVSVAGPLIPRKTRQ